MKDYIISIFEDFFGFLMDVGDARIQRQTDINKFLVLAGQRCAKDLKESAAFIPDPHEKEKFTRHSETWEKYFENLKDINFVYDTIVASQEKEIRLLKKQLEESKKNECSHSRNSK